MLRSIHQDWIVGPVPQGFLYVFGILGKTCADHRRDQFLAIGNDLPFRRQKSQPPESFPQLKGKQQTYFSQGDQGRVYLCAEANMTGYDPTSLGHSMDLAFLHVKAAFHGYFRQYLTGQDDTLPSYTHDQDVLNTI
jgi:hypothetical protein